ncbi:putative bifunctional diguanylate cyclase/phosphodiesterase [Zavarzinia sp.]|uniref:putative bifunctional diguanylate cyclase/phosphodiesterase n=1 Tax=Zavarzinia sp. TaxID=2027920 RepID=UPI00356802F6
MTAGPGTAPVTYDRRWLIERLDTPVTPGQAKPRRAVVLFEIVGIANIEDLLGFSGRERVIEGVGLRLREALAEVPVGHLFANEYFALLESERVESEVVGLIDRALQAIGRPVPAGTDLVRVDLKMGVVFAPDHGESSDVLLSRAIAALNAAGRYRQQVAYFDEEIARAARLRAEMHADLRHALERGQMSLHLQPKARLPDNLVVGFEALVRWHRPGQGSVDPQVFIELAEETGLIRDIDLWVATEAGLAIMRINAALGTAFSVAINASPSELDAGGYVLGLQQVMAETGVPAEWLEVEMTETTIAEDMEAAVCLLASIRALGVKVSIDDFGMGYSSLHRLRRFPATGLKIDRSFVDELATSKAAALIVRATVELGHGMGLEIIAEGVETVEQLELLARLGVDQYQGYRLAKPMPEDELMRWLAARQGGAAGAPNAPAASRQMPLSGNPG